MFTKAIIYVTVQEIPLPQRRNKGSYFWVLHVYLGNLRSIKHNCLLL